jgi:hypothetical protein
MKKDPGAEKLLQRSDFKAIYDGSTASRQELRIGVARNEE